MAELLIRNTETILGILQRACSQRELMILATPYLRFESSFVQIEGKEIHAAATMGREDAQYGLRNADLRIRFPHGVGFLEGATQMRGFGMVEGRRTVRLAIPGILQDDDMRRAYRVDRVGRVSVSFSTPALDLFQGALVNISTTGARVFCSQVLKPETLKTGDELIVTIPLLENVRINTTAKVRHSDGHTFGIEFLPQLEEAVLVPLSRWTFERREEDLERLARRGANPSLPASGPRPASDLHSGFLLVSQDTLLESALKDLLGGMQPLRRLPPTIQALKEAIPQNPALVILHASGLGLDDRRRLKAMAEAIPGRVPFMLLGTAVEGGPLLEFGTELKATVSIVFHPARATFFQRLVLGVLRRTYEGGESPLAPMEPEAT